MKKEIIKTNRREFEIFVGGKGTTPICISHLYQEFLSGDEPFSKLIGQHYKVILVNLKNAGHTCKANSKKELTMEETVEDLESIREKLGYNTWAFAESNSIWLIASVSNDNAYKGIDLPNLKISKK